MPKVVTQQEQRQNTQTINKMLNQDLLNQILAGLPPMMTDEQIRAYAENLLTPQLNAQMEEAQNNYEATRLAKEQEIEDLARGLAEGMNAQNAAYRQSVANVENAALSRGMGRSSYTMQTLANQGDALSKALSNLMDENARQTSQIRAQITQAEQQRARTQGRLQSDYATNLAAKMEEMRMQQEQQRIQNYMNALSHSIGQQTNGTDDMFNVQVQEDVAYNKQQQDNTRNIINQQKQNWGRPVTQNT